MIHLAITRQVKAGKEGEFEQAICTFIQRSLSESGVAGVHLLKPAPGSDSREYGILRSFESATARDEFYASVAVARWQLLGGSCK